MQRFPCRLRRVRYTENRSQFRSELNFFIGCPAPGARLEVRFALPRPRTLERISTGIPAIDALAAGGIPRGALTCVEAGLDREAAFNARASPRTPTR